MDYEKLGSFYLGRVFDPEAGRATPEPLLLVWTPWRPAPGGGIEPAF